MSETLKKRERDSNFEALRLIAMFYVLVLHANQNYRMGLVVAALESLAIVAVPVFVMISGWYGIRFRWTKIASLLFQVILFGVLLTLLLPGQNPITQRELANILTSAHYPFIQAYIILVVIAPMINSFLDNADRRSVWTILVAYFTIQTVLSFLSNHIWWNDGQSVLTFLGLYMVGRYARNIHFIRVISNWGGVLYMAISAIIFFCWTLINSIKGSPGRLFNYTNPLIIASALSLIFYFSQVRLRYSPLINFLASGCLGVYLLHMHPGFLHSIFYSGLNYISDVASCRLFEIVGVAAFLLLIFICGILLDKLCLWIWNGVERAFNRILA